MILAPAVVVVVVACGGGSKGGGAENESNLEVSPEVAVTDSITFTNSSVLPGLPPAANRTSANLGPNDPIVEAPAAATSSISPGGTGRLDIKFSNVIPNTNFSVDVRFGTSTGRFIRIPISQTVTGGSSSGNLSIPFNLGANICSNVANIQHQISCYESVNVGGVFLSKEQARTMLLSCGTTAPAGGGGRPSGVNFCFYNYPKAACDQLINGALSGQAPLGSGSYSWNAGSGVSACSVFPNVQEKDKVDFFATSGGLGVDACQSLGGCGACAFTSSIANGSLGARAMNLSDEVDESVLVGAFVDAINQSVEAGAIKFTPN